MRVIKNDLLGETNMYVYKITNKINNKMYIGITNDIKRRWSNECSYPSEPKRRQIIQEAIHKYGKENFDFCIMHRNISIEEAIILEQQYIKEYNTLIPNGYNVSPGGEYHPSYKTPNGANNPNACLSEEQAQYILNNRDKPLYLLYPDYAEKISYEQFKKVYHHQVYKNLKTDVQEYPYNREFSCQFTSGPLEYDDVVNLRIRYNNGEYWKDVYNDYKWAYQDEMTFWNVYYGNRYKLVMPEVFTKENRKKHSSFKNKGSNNGRAKLTEKDVVTIRKLYKDGMTTSELYKAYPQISKTSVRDIINGKTWKHLL